MSIHRSLRTAGKLIRKRNVWTRMERIEALKKEDKWQDGDPVVGLAKVRTGFKTKTKKKLKEEAAATKADDTDDTENSES